MGSGPALLVRKAEPDRQNNTADRMGRAHKRPDNLYAKHWAGLRPSSRGYDETLIDPARRRSLRTVVRAVKGAFIDWRREHWPRNDALMRGDLPRLRELVDQDRAREEMFRERLVFCVFCHALMIHAACGFFFCPYQRAGAELHLRARSVALTASDWDSITNIDTLGNIDAET